MGIAKYNNINTFDDFKKFIEDNNIKSRDEFNHRFGRVNERFRKLLSEEEREILLPTKINNYSNLNTVDDFKKFILENNIKSISNFRKRFPAAASKFCSLPQSEKNKIEFEITADHRKYKLDTVQDFQNFIDENNIDSSSDFQKRFTGVYNRFRKKIVGEDRKLIKFKGRKHLDLSMYNSLEDFQRYIDENNIKSPMDFMNKNRGLYGRYINKFSKEDRKLIYHPDEIVDPYSTLEGIQKFIDDNKIKSITVFRKQYKTVYKKYLKYKKSWDNDILVFEEQSYKLKYKGYDTLEDFQKFIDENNIKSLSDFRTVDNNLLSRCYDKLSSEERDLLVFCEGKRHSTGENFLIRLFESNSIKYTTEKTFDKLKNIKSLRYDFYLPEYNILVEHHGEAHFGVGIYYSEGLIENDKRKFEFANKNNLTILYFTIYEKIYEEFGYFTEVLTDPQTLIQKIKEIGLTNQSSINN